MIQSLIDIFGTIIILIIAFFAIGLIFAKLYHRASKEIAFVRTGMGGQKVVVNGGALVVPVLHDVIQVNMNTLRLEVTRANTQALITRDRMRVDVQAEFYVRVQPTEEAIANAAQTLGKKTLAPMELKELIEGKFVDALRSVAAEMGIEELHEQRVSFVQKVQIAVSEDLMKNGLELESVSLTALDQTNREYFNPDNAFDAAGLTRLTNEIEEKRRRRNEIEQETEVAIKAKNLEAEQRRLELERDEEYARLQQQQEIAIRKADQEAELAAREAQRKREAEAARIEADRQTQQSRIKADQEVAEATIAKDRQLREAEIQAARSLEVADVEKRKTLELAEQERAIVIAEKSREESVARAEADQARAKAVKAEEEVVTVRETAAAERRKATELVEASQEAERAAIGVRVASAAEKEAATNRADAARLIAAGEADRIRIGAEGEATAEKLRAEAAEARYKVEAEGKRAINEADNVLSSEIIAMRLREALLASLPEVIAQSVKPMERIEGIKIVQFDGMGGNGGGNGNAEGSAGNLADQVVSTALRYRSQAPLVDALLKEVGLDGGSLSGLTGSTPPPAPKPAPAE